MPEEQTMNFSLIADYADVLAALGVILSLVFVAAQVRQNTTQLKQGPRDQLLDRLNTFHATALDKEVAATIVKGQQSYESLNETERLAFEGWMHQFIFAYATAFRWRYRASFVLNFTMSLNDAYVGSSFIKE